MNRTQLLKHARFLILCLLMLLSLTGCWDKVELESRGFVVSIGVDRFEPGDKESHNNPDASSDKKSLNKTEDKEEDKEEEEKEEEEEKCEEEYEEKKSKDGEEEEENTPNNLLKNRNENDQQTKKAEKEAGDSEKAVSIGFTDGKPMDSRFTVTMALPNLGAIVGNGGEDKTKSIKMADDKTIAGAINIANVHSSQKLYFGQAKNCIFGEDILRDSELFKEALDSLERNQDISRTLIILGTSARAEEILKTDVTGEPLVGMFISNFYKNNASAAAVTFPLNLERLISDLRATGNAILPRIETAGSEVKLSGAAIIRDFSLAGWMNDQQTRGYLWYFGKGKGAELITEYNHVPVPLRVSEQKSKVTFAEENGRIIVFVNIRAEGSAEEYTLMHDTTLSQEDVLKELEKRYAQLIANELLSTENLFQKKYAMDGFGLLDSLRKQNNNLYLKYKDQWDDAIANMEMVPIVSVTIRNTGSIK